jgi:hypothetical protein
MEMTRHSTQATFRMEASLLSKCRTNAVDDEAKHMEFLIFARIDSENFPGIGSRVPLKTIPMD